MKAIFTFLKAWAQHFNWRKETLILCQTKTVHNEASEPLMSQFTLIGILGWHIRLHYFHQCDTGHFHTHPRRFISLCIRGGYEEEVDGVGTRVVKPGTFTFKLNPEEAHYIYKATLPCWTLVITTPVTHKWRRYKK